MSISRREVLLWWSALLTMGAGLTPETLHAQESVATQSWNVLRQEPSLKDAANPNGIEIGTSLRANKVWSRIHDPLVTHHVNIVTPDFSWVPRQIAPLEDRKWWDLDKPRKVYDFGVENGLGVNWHSLYWKHSNLPWTEAETFEEATRLYGWFIRDVMQEFPETKSWVVFNEIFDAERLQRLWYDQQSYHIRRFWLRFVKYILDLVREISPDSKIVMNEVNTECGRGCSQVRRNVLDMVDELLDMGAPIDIIWLQWHLNLNPWERPSPDQAKSYIDQLASRWLEAHITELDNNDLRYSGNRESRDRQSAEEMARFLEVVLRSPNLKRISFWWLADEENWLSRAHMRNQESWPAPRPALFETIRHEGVPFRDRFSYEPKPVFHSVLDVLWSASPRDNQELASL